MTNLELSDFPDWQDFFAGDVIEVKNPGYKVATVMVGGSGEVETLLPPGRYWVLESTPDGLRVAPVGNKPA